MTVYPKATLIFPLSKGGGGALAAGGCYNKHFVISFFKGKVVALRAIHYVFCPFLAGF